MCTVTFIPTQDNFIITSNRDEHVSRPYSYGPKEQSINGCKLFFPKDPKAGGTWFAINEFGFVGVLLNGAFDMYKPQNNFVISRGLFLLNIMSLSNPSKDLNSKALVLTKIQPFTLILFENHKLFEFRWDGKQKYFKELNKEENHIWSSATLYSREAMKQRERLFSTFVNQNKKIYPSDVEAFHSQNDNDYYNGFIIDRPNGLRTFSITQAIVEEHKIVLNHSDLLKGKKYSCQIPNEKQVDVLINNI